jgi:tRNA(Ile)-lysidine synthase
LKYYGPFAWKDVFRLLNSEVGKQVSNADYRIVRERKGLFLSKSPSKALQSVLVKSGDSSIESPIKIAFSIHKAIDFKMVKNSRCAVLDYGKLHFPLLVRPWQIGDSFTPLGMKGKKKVSDFMIDEKFSTYQKENTLVICSLDTIVCIVGHRINDEFKLVPETEKVYLVEPLKIEHGK